jgi:cytochrome c oxidase subunit I+III
VGFLVIFVLGGLTGVMLAAVPFNWQAHDTYFVVAHFHYVLIGGVIFPIFAGLYYWLPKITGRLLNERLGRWNFWLMFVFFNLTFFPMHVTGLLGMPRRVWTYGEGLGWSWYNFVSTIGAWGFGAAVLLFVVNLAWSLWRGSPAGADPWGSDTLEWRESSPPPEAQFGRLPVVASRHPGWDGDVRVPDARVAAAVALLDHAPTRWRGALVVSAVEGRPLAVVQVPGPTIVPLVVSLGIVGLLAAALVDSGTLAVLGSLVTLAGIVGWFWPRRVERFAQEDLGTPSADRLPLAVAGPLANGWWATVVLVLVLATALVTLVASYVYLGDGTLAWAPSVPESGLALLSTGLLLACIPAIGVAALSVRRDAAWMRRLALATTMGLGMISIAVGAAAYRALGVAPHETAYGSIVVALFGYQGLVVGLALAMLVLAQLWAWLAPRDPRGHAVTFNGALVVAFAGFNALVVFATVYLAPRLG